MRRQRHIPLALIVGLAGCTVEPPRALDPPAPVAEEARASAEPASSVDPSKRAEPAPVPKDSSPPPLLAARPASKVDVDAVLARANRALESGNLPNAIRGLDEVLAQEPTNRRALSALAQSTQRYAMSLGRPQSSPLYLKSADAIRRLRAIDQKLSPDERSVVPVILYNEACTLAIMGESDRAIKSLKESFDAGFPRIDLVDTDPELDSLRQRPTFRELQAELESRHIENLLETFEPFAFDFKLPGLDGKPRTLAELRGKLTIIDLWGTWCIPCRKEIPHLVDLAKRYKEAGLRIVGVNYEKDDGEKARESVRSFVKEYQIEYPCVFGDQATLERIPAFEGYPTTLFLSPDGRVRLKLSGYQSLLALEVAVKRLLDEKTAEPVKAD